MVIFQNVSRVVAGWLRATEALLGQNGAVAYAKRQRSGEPGKGIASLRRSCARCSAISPPNARCVREEALGRAIRINMHWVWQYTACVDDFGAKRARTKKPEIGFNHTTRLDAACRASRQSIQQSRSLQRLTNARSHCSTGTFDKSAPTDPAFGRTIRSGWNQGADDV
jgi:hypothetical protein